MGLYIDQAIVSPIQVLTIRNELPHTSELETVELTLGRVDLASFVVSDDS